MFDKDAMYLISADSWFYAPDGSQLNAAYGKVEILSDETLGLKTNRNSTNWYAKVGTEKNHVIIAGCQIHYAVKCNVNPTKEGYSSWAKHEGKVIESKIPCPVFFGEE